MAKGGGTGGRVTPTAGTAVARARGTVARMGENVTVAAGAPAPERRAGESVFVAIDRMAPVERIRALRALNDSFKVGQRVLVRWGYGSGFRAKGVGVITKLSNDSAQIRLTTKVDNPTGGGGPGWPAGFVLKGIPRPSANSIMKGKLNFWHSFEPIGGR